MSCVPRLFARRQISSTGSPTARWPLALKPRSRRRAMPSSSTACVRFFSSSSSSSGTKPSVRKRLGGMLATASRCVSAPRNVARSHISSSARRPSLEPLYASRILWYFIHPPFLWLLHEQPDALDGGALGLERFGRPFRIVLARFIPIKLVELLQGLLVLGLVDRGLERIVQALHDFRRHAFRSDEAIRRVRHRVDAELLHGGRVPARAPLAERGKEPERAGVDLPR